jgi:hypothetical protein
MKVGLQSCNTFPNSRATHAHLERVSKPPPEVCGQVVSAGPKWGDTRRELYFLSRDTITPQSFERSSYVPTRLLLAQPLNSGQKVTRSIGRAGR